MRNFLILTCSVIMISSVTFADDTVETCANGAGTVVIGAVSGHKYCNSKNGMNWWNAVTWCDGLGRRLFDLSDCACSDTTANCVNKCPELEGRSTFKNGLKLRILGELPILMVFLY